MTGARLRYPVSLDPKSPATGPRKNCPILNHNRSLQEPQSKGENKSWPHGETRSGEEELAMQTGLARPHNNAYAWSPSFHTWKGSLCLGISTTSAPTTAMSNRTTGHNTQLASTPPRQATPAYPCRQPAQPASRPHQAGPASLAPWVLESREGSNGQAGS